MSVSTASPAAGRPPLPPGPRFATPLGFLHAMRERPLEFFEDCRREYGDVVCARFPPMRSVALFAPEHIHHVLVANHRNYWKGRVFSRLRVITGEGLLFAEGEPWLRRRRLVGPAFRRDRVEGLAPHVTAATGALIERWERERADGEPFDAHPELSKAALDVVCRGLFGTDILERADIFHDCVNVAVSYANFLVNHLVRPPLWVPTARNRELRRATAVGYGIIDEIIASHRAAPELPDDLLGLLLAARDEETGEGLDDVALRDELITFLNAGHETTAVTLSWALHALAGEPGWMERLRAEVDEVLGDRLPGLGDLPRLDLTRRVVLETLRLYPAAWAIPRESLGDDEIGGYRIPRRTSVLLCPFVTHRHPELWKDPERFDPDRFLPERRQALPRLAYLPFGAGGRRCIGEDFAMLEAQIVLAALAQRFSWEQVPGREPTPDPLLTLRPGGGVWLSLRRRGLRGAPAA